MKQTNNFADSFPPFEDTTTELRKNARRQLNDSQSTGCIR